MSAMPTAAPVRLIRLPEVCRRTGLGKTTIYELRKSGAFPPPVVIVPPRVVGYVEAEVDSWIAARIAERGAA